MLFIRKHQMDVLSAAALETRLDEMARVLRQAGLDAEVEPGAGILRVRDAAGIEARLEHRLGDSATLVTTDEGRTFRFEGSVQDRINAIVDPGGLATTLESDPVQRSLAIQRGAASQHRLTYDKWQRLRESRFPDGTSVTLEYGTGDFPETVTDRNGKTTRIRYDPKLGSPLIAIDPLGNQTRFEYDESAGAPSTIHLPNGHRWQFGYDQGGELASMGVNDNAHATYATDPLTGARTIRHADGTLTSFRSENGRLVEAVNGTCAVRFEYDAAGRLLAEEVDGRRVEYLRDPTGALVGLVTPEGEKLHYRRDREGRVNAVLDWAGRAHEITYNPQGTLAGIRSPNGVLLQAEANPLGYMTSLTVRTPQAETPLVRQRWEYDVCDRVIGETTDERAWAFAYDGCGRLAGMRDPDNRVANLALDANGNRRWMPGGAASYNGFNQIVNHAGATFVHDALGNLVRGICPVGAASFAYNGRNQMVLVETPSGRARYAYDALGRRVWKEWRGRVTRYVWVGTNLLAEVTTGPDGTLDRRDYLHFPAQPMPLAMRVGGPRGAIHALHAGRRGEVLAATDARGRAVWQARYGADGGAEVTLAEIEQPFRLAGQYFDAETGLHYNLARYYHPSLGRFLSVDPLLVDGGGGNFYLYGNGDPVNRIDPHGELFFVTILIGVAVGAALGAGTEAYTQATSNAGLSDGWAIAKAGLIGGAVGAIGAAVGVGATGVAVAKAGLASGGVAAVAVGGAATGGVIGSGMEAANQLAKTGGISNVGAIVKSGMVGALVGGLGGAAGAAVEGAAAFGAISGLGAHAGVGALSGAAGSAAEYCTEAIFGCAPASAEGFFKAVALGAGVGAVTGAIGGHLARRSAQQQPRSLPDADPTPNPRAAADDGPPRHPGMDPTDAETPAPGRAARSRVNDPQRQDAYVTGRNRGRQRIRDMEAAMQSGDPDRTRQAALEFLNDKHAMMELNQDINPGSQGIRDQVRQEIRNISAEVDRQVLRNLSRRYGLVPEIPAKADIEALRDLGRRCGLEIPAEVGREALINLIRTYGVDPEDIRVFNATNTRRSSTDPMYREIPLTGPDVSNPVSYDRDITVQRRARPGEMVRDPCAPGGWRTVESGQVEWIDIPAKELEDVYSRHFYGEANGIPPNRRDSIDLERAKHFTESHDQTCTDRLSADSYGSSRQDLDVAINNPDARFSDPGQISGVMEYKANEWFVDADRIQLSDPVRAEGYRAEGMRQTVKQWNNQVLRRAEAQGAVPPPQLRGAMEEMARAIRGEISPVQVEANLRAMGYDSPQQVAHDSGKFIEMLDKLRPRSR